MAAGIARRLDHRLGRDARRPPAGAVRRTLHRAALRRGRRTVASWLRAVPRGATTSAITTCSAASDARLWRSPGRCSASSLSGSRATVRARRWSSASTTRPPSGTGPTSRGRQASQPTPGPAGSPFSTATSGSVWPAWSTPALGSDRLPICALVHPGQGYRLDGGVLRLGVPHQAGAGRRQIEWLVQQLGKDHPPIWVVTDGAYASGRS